MKTIIAGSRLGVTREDLDRAVAALDWSITCVVSGCAPGADTLGEIWAYNHDIPVIRYPADWRQGKAAGMRRNAIMARNAEALLALWDGKSPGTAHMIETARKYNLQISVWRVA